MLPHRCGISRGALRDPREASADHCTWRPSRADPSALDHWTTGESPAPRKGFVRATCSSQAVLRRRISGMRTLGCRPRCLARQPECRRRPTGLRFAHARGGHSAWLQAGESLLHRAALTHWVTRTAFHHDDGGPPDIRVPAAQGAHIMRTFAAFLAVTTAIAVGAARGGRGLSPIRH